jgi:histidyl-tRNA synthetase
MHDATPDIHCRLQWIQQKAADVAHLFGFQEVSTPIVEQSTIFERTAPGADIVLKELFRLQTRGQKEATDTLVLRPEGTAPLMRMILSEGLSQTMPQRLFYRGPMFRYDRPQKGRLRQFHQIGIEYIGHETPFADVDVIACATHFLSSLGIKGWTLEINTLGTPEDRKRYEAALKNYLLPHRSSLSSDSQRRLDQAALRILDSKNVEDQKLVRDAPRIDDFLSPEAQSFFDHVRRGLDTLNISYTINPQLVRGLDYYGHTTFEFTTTELGTQGTILAGGRYDGLSQMLGGPQLPGVGWAAGVERLMMMLPENTHKKKESAVILMPQDELDIPAALSLGAKLRKDGIALAYAFPPAALGKRLKQAQKRGGRFVLILGNAERSSHTITLKDLEHSLQESLPQESLSEVIHTKIKETS